MVNFYDGIYIDDGVNTNKITMDNIEDSELDIFDEDFSDTPLEVEVSLYDPPVIFDFREKDPREVTSYDAFEVVSSALTFIKKKLGFLAGLGRIVSMNHVDTDYSDTAQDGKQGSIINGSLTFNIRLISAQRNRILNMDVVLPIKEGKFVTPSVFKSDNKDYILSPDGVRKAFRENRNVVRIVDFPEKRKSHRWPRILDKTSF